MAFLLFNFLSIFEEMVLLDYKKRRIRLEDERWDHIKENHPETKDVISYIIDTLNVPDFVQQGNNSEILAVKRYTKTPISRNKYCVVVYKTTGTDGFVITSYFTRRPSFKRKLLWKK
jgi:hypothetical protein